MAGELLLSPSPNWFCVNSLDCRAEDRLLVSATFKAILVHHLPPGKNLPKVIKVIPNHNEKVHLVSLCPQASHPDYGHTVACVGEGSSIRLFNLHTGDMVALHTRHEGFSVNGVCWGNVDNEEVVVTIGGGGRLIVWQPVHNVCDTYTLTPLTQNTELTVVEVNPNDRSQAIVAASKDIALVNLRNGRVATWLRGHDMNIYCLRWYNGEKNPFVDELPVNTRAEAMMEGSEDKGAQKSTWKGSKGPFFASSDYGRHIYLWDVPAKRYFAKKNVPISSSNFKQSQQYKDKSKLKHHIPITWYGNGILSSTVQGELLHWTFQQGKWKFKAVHHLHNRAIFNLMVMDDLVITSGQDRMLHGYDIKTDSHMFQLSTLGSYATTLAFCPQDATRLAFGLADNSIRLFKFGSPTPLQTSIVHNNVNGKILSISWHPEEEGRLLFGTASGQVGWLNVLTGQMWTFAYYHQKATYKVEWAPPVCQKTLEIAEPLCAYSFGDREIRMRLTSTPLADPLSLRDIIPDSDKKFAKDITEFSFTPDYSYLAIGFSDGQVLVYRREDLVLMVKVVVVKKAIQHLLWKPEEQSGSSYTLAVASNEFKVYIFVLDSYIKEQEDKNGDEDISEMLVTQSTRELSGHESRVVWLAWSPHKPSLLASASYDRTIQLWDTDDGSMLGNYGGHTARVFRVEFSASDPDLLYSCAEETSLHCWRVSKLTCKTPAESNAVMKEFRSKKEQGATAAEETTPPSQDVKEKIIVTVGGEVPVTPIPDPKVTKKSPSDTHKKPSVKSFFPKLHTVYSRKKGFHHLVLLSLLALKEKEKENPLSTQLTDESNEDDLEDLDDEPKVTEDIDPGPIVTNTTEKYKFLLEKDSEMASLDDFLYIMQMHGQPHQMDALLASEIEMHESRGHTNQVELMHCWRGSLGTYIRTAARQKKLNPFLVSSAPQFSIKLWETACEAYAEQLVAEGDVVTAASYLLNIHKAAEAIDILLEHRHHRVAFAIAKSRFGYSDDQLQKVINSWISSAIRDSNMELAASLQLSVGRLEDAARTLSRRVDSSSLFVSSVIYTYMENVELAVHSGLLALREASVKQEMDKVDAFLGHLPGLEWFKVISTFQTLLLKIIHQKDTTNYSYFLDASQSVTEAGEGSEAKTCLVKEVKARWETRGFSSNQYEDLYNHIKTFFSTQQNPSSVKELWFLVSVSLSQCLLSPTYRLWDQHMTQALEHGIRWGKPDQLMHLTHALLPGGKEDLEMLRSTMPDPREENPVPSSSLDVLWHHYERSEAALSQS